MKVVLDTNALYAFMGINKDPNIKQDKFRELLSNPSNKVTLSSVSIYEFLVKYENDVVAIRNGLSFITQHIDKVHTYGNYLPLTDDVNSLLQYSDEQIRKTVNSYKERKIEIESRFSALFLGYLLFQYTLSYFFEKHGEAESEQAILRLSQRCIPKAVQDEQVHLEKAFRDGYNANKAQKIATDEFNSLLTGRLSSWLAFLEFVDSKPKSSLQENEIFNEYLQFYNSSYHVKKFHRHADNINMWIAKYDSASKQIASKGLSLVWRRTFEAKGVYGAQVDYMEWKLSSMSQQDGDTPSKFRKNDISDMLILTVLNDNDSILISFDRNVRKFITHIKNKSENYINNVYSLPV